MEVEQNEGGLKLKLVQDGPIPLNCEFACEAGELVALVGPSGSGKSTILRAIAGLYAPKFGSVMCHEDVWLNTDNKRFLSPQKRRVGMMFQEPSLFPHMSALENLIVALDHVQPGDRRAKAYEWLDRVNLKGLEERKPSALSGGQQQRVALARALAREPQVLLLDEPFSAVDRVTRRKLQAELVALRQGIKIPVVLVTHDLEEATLLADKICVLHRGKSLDYGLPDRIMTRPNSPLTARLVDLPNIYEGVVEAGEQDDGWMRLRWQNIVLEVDPVQGFEVGDKVSWVIPPAFVVFHQRKRPSRGERENPIQGRVSEVLVFGEISRVTMMVEGMDNCPLVISLNSHVVRRNEVKIGENITVSLLARGIHLMAAGEKP